MWRDHVSYLQGTEVRPGDIENRTYRHEQFAWEEWIVRSRGWKVHRQRHVEGQGEDREVPFAQHGAQCTWEKWTKNNDDRPEWKNIHVTCHVDRLSLYSMERLCLIHKYVPKVLWWKTFHRNKKNNFPETQTHLGRVLSPWAASWWTVWP